MHVLNVRNVHEALPRGVDYLKHAGHRRSSRNGDVLLSTVPVATVYDRPVERVVWWPERDYNVFFNIYESLWMLMGRNDVAPLKRYVKNFDRYSDDGSTLHGAYGHRWRRHYEFDQLEVIADRLKHLPNDRRSVLSMWNPLVDLHWGDDDGAKDVPCNDMATFQLDRDGRLDLVVFCRSNDIVWGAYYANAFHFSMLLEYMAAWIGVPVGTYTQVSVNYHGYLNTLQPLIDAGVSIAPNDTVSQPATVSGQPLPLLPDKADFTRLTPQMQFVVESADNGFEHPNPVAEHALFPSMKAAFHILRAHDIYKNFKGSQEVKVLSAQAALHDAPLCDWTTSAHQWFNRRLGA